MIGDKLGLYKAMAGAGPISPADLARRTETTERYVREWLSAMAASGYVTYDAATQTYTLPEEQAMALAQDDSPVFLPGAFQVALAATKAVPKVSEAFRSGGSGPARPRSSLPPMRGGMLWGRAPVESTHPMQRAHFASFVLTLPILGACAAPEAPRESTEPAAPSLFGNLGRHHRLVSTKSALAQRWFDEALVLAFAFNHDEAIRSFRECARLDPYCAMAWWGIALCNGPHINNPTMDEEHSRAAWEALANARELEEGAMPVERALIEALAQRYAEHAPEDRGPLDVAYAEAMREVWRANPKDADVGALCAEALMDLHPWDLWNEDGTPKPQAPEIVEILEKLLAMAPDHPLANHLYIHAVEASAHPERATASADRLRTLVPGAGHLVHMPAHIYARTGRWADAAAANEQAIEVDGEYRARSPEQGFYHVYMSHNHQFLAWASMMQGNSAVAIAQAREMVAAIPPETAEAMAPFLDGLLALPYATLVRFGRWDKILKEPEPASYLPVTRALWHFARGTALASTGKTDEAEVERKTLDDIRARVKEDAKVGNTPSKDILAIASHVLAGEIAAQRGQDDDAIVELTQAVKIEDGNLYDEPPDWLQPVRHTLGAVLLRAGQAGEAEKVYREDLQHWPENGWSLWGLARSFEKQGRHAEAVAAQERFEATWAHADMKLDSTCLCLPGVAKAAVGR